MTWDICTGNAGYGMDAHVEGMVFASVEHPPVLGGKVKSYDEKAPLQVGREANHPDQAFTPPHVFQPLGGVAVIADNTWATFQGRKKLNVTWENGANASYDSEPYKKQLQQTARKPGKVARNIGDVDAAFAKGGKIVEADYYVPLLTHAPMEPRWRSPIFAMARSGSGRLPKTRRRCKRRSLPSWHSQGKRDLPRAAAGRRIWTQVEAGLCGRGGDLSKAPGVR